MKKIYLILIASMFLVVTGCDKFLNVDQPDIVEDENAYKTYNEGLVAVIGCYQGLQDAMGQMFLLSNLRSDLLVANDNAPAYFKELSDGIYNPENPYLDPSVFYRIVNQTNDVLANLDKLMENDPANFTEAVRNKFAAEVTVVRALAYFYIIQNFNVVYYYEDALTEYDPSFNLSPTPKDQVLAKLIDQIEYYIYDLNVDNFVTPDQIAGNTRWYKFRFGERATVYQLLAELNLELKDYNQAFEYLHKVITDPENSDRYSMSDKFGLSKWIDIFESYAYRYNTADEILLTVPFYKRHEQMHNIQYWCSPDADGVYYVRPSPICVVYFESQGENGDRYRGHNSTYGVSGDKLYVRKYIANSDAYSNDNSIVLFRAGDTWLDAGEALNHMEKPAAALQLINEGIFQGVAIKGISIGVRGRVNLQPLRVQDFEPIRSKLELDEEITLQDSVRATDMAILQERARETAFETNRFYDIKRIAEYWDDPEIMATIIASKYKGINEDKIAVLHERFMDKTNWYISE